MESIMSESEKHFEKSEDNRLTTIKAGFTNRVIARSIDFIIVIALCKILPVIGFFGGITYLLIADGLFDGRSLGKKLLGLSVIVGDDGEAVTKCGYRESVIRNSIFAAAYLLFGFLAFVPLIGWFFGFLILSAVIIVETLIIIGSENDRRLGDELAKTQVIEEVHGGTGAQ
jgi:uncharacterized RDD family membrane protein YckC